MSQRSVYAVILMAVILGSWVYFSIYDWDFFLGRGGHWDILYGADYIQAAMGGMYYMAEPWHLPLLHIQGVSLPEGQNAMLTVSMPPMAFLAKIIYPLIGEPFIYMGVWHYLCYVLQSVWVVAFLLKFRVYNPIVLGAAVLLSLYLPMMPYMINMDQYICQFLLIGMLYFSLRRPGQELNWACDVAAGAWVLLVGVADTYLLAMSFPLWAASVADRWRLKRLTFLGAALRVSAVFASVVLCYLLAGFVRPSAGLPDYFTGYGKVSVNLAALFYGHVGDRMSPLTPTFLEKFLGGFPGFQTYGYVYLGWAIIALWAFLIVTLLRKNSSTGNSLRIQARSFARENGLVLLTLGLLYLHAASNHSYFFGVNVLRYEIPEFAKYLVMQLRSTYRFAWPLMHAMALLAVIAVGRLLGRSYWSLLMVPLVLLQVYESAPGRERARDFARDPLKRGDEAVLERENSTGFYREIWEQALPAYKKVIAIPNFQCSPLWTEVGVGPFRTLLMMATARLSIPTSDCHSARWDRDCMREEVMYMTKGLEPNTVYVLDKRKYAWFLYGAGLDVSKHCLAFERGHVCAQDITPFIRAAKKYPAYLREVSPSRAATFDSFGPAKKEISLESLPWNKEVEFTSDYAYAGWIRGDHAMRLVASPAAILARLSPYRGSAQLVLKADLVSGVPGILSFRLPGNAKPFFTTQITETQTLEILLPSKAFDGEGNLIVLVEGHGLPDGRWVYDHRYDEDPHQNKLLVRTLKVEKR